MSPAGDARFGAAARRAATVAAQALGWTPATFWNATPAELRTALGLDEGAGGAAALSRDALAALMETFPDG